MNKTIGKETLMDNMRYELRPYYDDGQGNIESVPFHFIYNLEEVTGITMYENFEDGTQDHLIDFDTMERARMVLCILIGALNDKETLSYGSCDDRVSDFMVGLPYSLEKLSRIRYLLANPFFTG